MIPTQAPGPPPQAAGGDPADQHLHEAIAALQRYAQAEQDPQDRQAAQQIVGALQQLAQKDRSQPGAMRMPSGPTDYRQGGTVTGRFFGNQ